jgi:transcriptional regulator with GAF, ATPase, and Fis domain
VTIPLTADGRVIGALAFGTIRAEREWPDSLVDRLRLLATVFAHALARKESQARLQEALAQVQQMRDRLAQENVQLRHEVKTLRVPRSLVSESAAARHVLAQIEAVAPAGATVLLLGETMPPSHAISGGVD